MEQPRKTWSAGQKQQHRPRRWLPVMLVTVAVLAVLGLLVWYAMGRRALPQSSAATGGTASEAASQPVQQAQTAQARRRRQRDFFRQFLVADAAILLQEMQEAQVGGVENHAWKISAYLEVKFEFPTA